MDRALEPVTRELRLAEHAPHLGRLLHVGSRLVQDLRRLRGVVVLEVELGEREVAVEALGRELDRLAELKLGRLLLAERLLGLAEREHHFGIVGQRGEELGELGLGLRTAIERDQRAADTELGFGVRLAAAEHGRVLASPGRGTQRRLEAGERIVVALLAHSTRPEPSNASTRYGSADSANSYAERA